MRVPRLVVVVLLAVVVPVVPNGPVRAQPTAPPLSAPLVAPAPDHPAEAYAEAAGVARRSTLVAFALDAGVIAASGIAANALITRPCYTASCAHEEAGFTLLYAGMAAGMAAGHFYAGDPRRALIGLGIRGAAMGFIAWGNSQNDSDFSIDEPGYLLGLPLLLAGTAYSLVTTPRSVADFNARAVAVMPGLGPGGGAAVTVTARL